MSNSLPRHDAAFQVASSNIRFGRGVTREVGFDLAELGAKRTLVIIDRALRDLPTGAAVFAALDDAHVLFDVFDEVEIEPSDASFLKAAETARAGGHDAFLAVGGGSTIDTAKAANLYATYPADLLEYVNAPIGRGRPVPGPLKPLIAIPTTAGTGSETTGVAIFDYRAHHAKTGIAHRYLKPTLGLIDPENTRTLPPAVAASAGLDVLSHALESFTALPYDQRPRPSRPSERPAYQGSNPISDVWSVRALQLTAAYLERAYRDPGDDEARAQMLLAAAMAGVGFGNAGVHLPHGMSYPVAGRVRDFRQHGYTVDHPLIPHGISVVLNTPAVMRFTAPACPRRHLQAAEALGIDVSRARDEDAGSILSDYLVRLLQRLDIPNGLRGVGYTSADIPALVEGTLPQHRVTKLSPRPVGPAELALLFEQSLVLW